MVNGSSENLIGGVQRTRGVRSFGLDAGSAALRGGLSGGAGKAVDSVARATMGSAISRVAEGTANRYRRRRGLGNPKEAQSTESGREEGKEEKKLTGVGFWMVLGTCIVKDLLDIFTNLTLILAIAVWVTTMLILFIVNFYLFYKGVAPTTRKVVWQAVVFLGDIVPFLSMFVGYTVYLIVIKVSENRDFSKLSEKVGGNKILGRLPIKSVLSKI